MKLGFVVTKMFVKFADAGKKELINWSIWEKFNNSQLKNNKYQCKAEFLVWRKLTTRVISRHHGREYIAIEMSESRFYLNLLILLHQMSQCAQLPLSVRA